VIINDNNNNNKYNDNITQNVLDKKYCFVNEFSLQKVVLDTRVLVGSDKRRSYIHTACYRRAPPSNSRRRRRQQFPIFTAAVMSGMGPW